MIDLKFYNIPYKLKEHMPYGYMNQLPPGSQRKKRFLGNRYVKFLHKFDVILLRSLIVCCWAMCIILFLLLTFFT